MKAVHFGAGNIGRGFIGEILANNEFEITFIDVNDTIIDALKTRKSYTIELADESHEQIQIDHVTGLNNAKEPEAVIQAISEADIVTTAIGPNILPRIAGLIAQGLEARAQGQKKQPIDVIACENMIGGSTYLKSEVQKHLTSWSEIEAIVGFPDAAVDRIVPMQQHDDPLFVQVEPFSEWVIQETGMKSNIHLSGVHYVADLEPYIERKLFSVNTGHATVAYTGALQGYQTIDEAMKDHLVVIQLKSVLEETGQLLIEKWAFDPEEHERYIEKIIQRFKNKYISDAITRVARTPVRKLGTEERFIRPVLELEKRNVQPDHLYETIGMIFNYHDPEDEQSRQLQELLAEKELSEVIAEVTGLTDEEIIGLIRQNIEKYAYVAA
ncbi:mannitol-1-phosphate 5-dehydrogenase [Enterococcus sp. 8G7_MSG3316]|uniref:Mannitol-1-phosphate 5-dehydrogenase n=1 Tax=Candidatus Enterococcus testudinis TaxID=1834191 RepID=A0A242AAA5_9ENTE|nr:mannitol-1-phosphate 5-dehydrogenase [Enterococcus sp. 8G7_MSG3316]OTN77987.1 mannitol-1-phosphate 5-dehydrogenase [Enterococcus sp. 8G7_MSG3316]